MELPQGALIYRRMPDFTWLGKPDGRIEKIEAWVRENGFWFQSKSIVDIGSNCGHMAMAYLDAGCSRVYCVEPRECFKNVAKHVFKQTYRNRPNDLFIAFLSEPLAWHAADVRDCMKELKQADILSCLGFIYHIANPLSVLTDLVAQVKPSVVLIESMIEEVPRDREEDPTGENSRSIKKEIVHIPSAEEVEGWMEQLGFTAEQQDIGLPPGRVFWLCRRK